MPDKSNKSYPRGNPERDPNRNRQKQSGGPPPPGNGPSGPDPQGGMRMTRSILLWVMMLAMLALGWMIFSGNTGGREITLGQLQKYFEQGAIKPGSAILKVNAIEAEIKEGQPEEAGTVRVPITQPSDYYLKKLDAWTGGEYKIATATGVWTSVLISLIPWILILGFIWFMLFRSIRSAGAGGGMFGSFVRSRHKVSTKDSTGVTFADVAGADEAKEELVEIVEFLKNPKKFQRLGGRIPRGVLLSGPPGCGKTMLAKAIAGEADVPFFSISGSDFVEMFVGVGASRVRDLFKQAKENSPCIIFLDEIDAVGRKRGSGFASGGNDEREQTLNAILVEMDGFDTNDQVIVIAATNREDVLDPALTRPGRFDRHVVVPPPDVKGRLEILKVHARKVQMSPNVDLEKLARGTPMFSGADLAAIINEAAILATMGGKEYVEQDDLDEARDKIKFGRAKKSRVIEERERVATAYHEAGHAVVQALEPDADPLHKVTIIPRGNYGGATFSLPERDRYGYGTKWLRATMRVLCAGRIAEERATGDVSSGAAGDIAQVSRMARTMVLEWGMSPRLGFVRYSDEQPDSIVVSKEYSDDTARIIDEEIKRFADEAYGDCTRIITENWERIKAVAESLLTHETLTAEEVRRLMRGDTLDKPTISALLEAERRKGAGAGPASVVKPEPEAGAGGPGAVIPQPA